MVQLVVQSCVVNVNRVDMLADLLLLEMIDFDFIVGMDWLGDGGLLHQGYEV